MKHTKSLVGIVSAAALLASTPALAQQGGGFRAFITNPLVIASIVATAVAVPVALHNSHHRPASP